MQRARSIRGNYDGTLYLLDDTLRQERNTNWLLAGEFLHKPTHMQTGPGQIADSAEAGPLKFGCMAKGAGRSQTAISHRAYKRPRSIEEPTKGSWGLSWTNRPRAFVRKALQPVTVNQRENSVQRWVRSSRTKRCGLAATSGWGRIPCSTSALTKRYASDALGSEHAPMRDYATSAKAHPGRVPNSSSGSSSDRLEPVRDACIAKKASAASTCF